MYINPNNLGTGCCYIPGIHVRYTPIGGGRRIIITSCRYPVVVLSTRRNADARRSMQMHGAARPPAARARGAAGGERCV
eukprot:COSAG02_NODE_57698_length_279_cov_3.144444_1_plen_78_part_10